MRVRIKWSAVGFFVALAFILSSLAGLAGFFSFWLSTFLPLYAIFSIIYLFVSWEGYAWFQNFSTNHPRKGETIKFEMRLSNDFKIPLSGGTCTFVVPGKQSELSLPIGVFPGSKQSITYTAEIVCPYRGTYIAGIKSIKLSTPLGIIKTEIDIVPQVFYVFPELYRLGQSIEKYTVSSGAILPAQGKDNEDPTVFEYTAPLLQEMSARRIAWKRWAQTGIPSVIVYGEARTRGIRIVLDLYPCVAMNNYFFESQPEKEKEKLAAEDIIMSAAFSVMQYLAEQRIAVTFITGGNNQGVFIDSEAVFKNVYEKSVNIIFSDDSFPDAAFSDENVAMLFSTRPIEAIYSEYEKRMYNGTEPHLFLCPPESKVDVEKKYAEVIKEQRFQIGSKSFFYVADVRNGSKEITDAFSV